MAVQMAEEVVRWNATTSLNRLGGGFGAGAGAAIIIASLNCVRKAPFALPQAHSLKLKKA